MPIVSAPLRAASAATTELSTPPDMATTIRAPLSGPAELEIRVHRPGQIGAPAARCPVPALYPLFTLRESMAGRDGHGFPPARAADAGRVARRRRSITGCCWRRSPAARRCRPQRREAAIEEPLVELLTAGPDWRRAARAQGGCFNRAEAGRGRNAP